MSLIDNMKTGQIDTINRLVSLCSEMELAKGFFYTLAQSKKREKTTDIDRRRRDVNMRFKAHFTKREGELLARELQSMGMGELEVKSGSGWGNRFHWTKGLDYISLAKELLAVLDKKPTAGPSRPKMAIPQLLEAQPQARQFVFKLRSGTILNLSNEDLTDLREFIDSVS